jgi:hypothetical protein
LTDLVWNDEILEVVRTKPTLKEASRALVNLANERGGHDNTTVILIGAPSDFRSKTAPRQKKDSDWLLWLVGGVVGLFFILVVASILTFNLLRRSGTVTATPAFSIPQPGLVTETPLFQSTPTALPTETASPDAILPTEPTVTLTPWPTNTTIP